MKRLIESPSWSYNNDLITISVIVSHVSDDYDPPNGVGEVYAQDTISVTERLTTADETTYKNMIMKLKLYRDKLTETTAVNMLKIVTITGQATVSDILSQIKTSMEE